MDFISSFTTELVAKSLDGLSQRHLAISSNLANAETPNYKRKDVTFEDQLSEAIRQQQHQNSFSASNDTGLDMQASLPQHFSTRPVYTSLEEIQPQAIETKDLQYRNDGNSVDVETEMVQLAKTTQRYIALSNLESRSLRSLQTVIRDGGQ